MRIITPPLLVGENDAFKNDLLKRKSFGDALLNLVVRSKDELVISLDGEWGEGKSTFIKMWQGLLINANIPNIYIDAFSNDYIDDAFICVASTLSHYAEKNIKKENYEKLLEFKEKSKKLGVQLLSWSAKIGIKAATLGVIKGSDIDELKDIKGDLSKTFSGVVGDFIEDRLNSQSKEIALIESFKVLLSEIPSKFEGNDNENPFVIIIDELDRCKPTFAVEVIEKIKHLFSVKNIVFILVMNKTQLEESIKTVYGQNIDAHTYLQKFISVETKIPKRVKDGYENDLIDYSKRLLKLHDLETWGDDNYIVDYTGLLSNYFNLSLRQLEKVFTNISLFYGTTSKNHIRIVQIVVFLSVIKVIAPKIFENLLNKKISYNDIARELKLTEISKEKDRKLFWIKEWIRYCLISEQKFKELPEDDDIKHFGSSLWEYKISREQVIPLFARQLNLFSAN